MKRLIDYLLGVTSPSRSVLGLPQRTLARDMADLLRRAADWLETDNTEQAARDLWPLLPPGARFRMSYWFSLDGYRAWEAQVIRDGKAISFASHESAAAALAGLSSRLATSDGRFDHCS